MRTALGSLAALVLTLVTSTAVAQPAPSPPPPPPMQPAPMQPAPQPGSTQPAPMPPAQTQPFGPQLVGPQPVGPQPSPGYGPLPPAPTGPQGYPQPGFPQGYGQPGFGPPGYAPLGYPSYGAPYADANGDLARLERVLGHHASDGRYYGIAMGVTGLVTGGVTIPTGVYMLKVGDNPIPGAITLGLGIGSAVGGMISFFVPSSDLDSLARSLEDKKESGKSPALIVAEVEHEWRERAEGTKAARRGWGITGVVLGAAFLGVGAGFAIADTFSNSISRTEQQALGAVFMGAGTANMAAGFTGIFLQTPIESTWEIYQSFKSGPLMMPAPPPRMGFAPVRSVIGNREALHGGVLTLSGAF